MRKVVFILAVFLCLQVTTYSLFMNNSAEAAYTGNSTEFTAEASAETLHQASSTGMLWLGGDCMPQPASVCLLTLSSLLLFNRKIKTLRYDVQ